MGTIIDKYLDRIVHSTNRDGVYAYRGQSEAQWPLHSGATRRLIREHGELILGDPEYADHYLSYHRDILVEPARTRGYGIEAGRDLTDLELLAKLQHFGAETGLLDFSWSPLVALWFAVENVDHDGKLFVIDVGYPIGIARVAAGGPAPELRDIFASPQGGQPILYWEPTSSGDALARILRQRSVFVIGRPLVTLIPGVVDEITIDKGDKNALITELAAIDFNEETLFQDVYGFAQASRRRRVPEFSPAAYNRLGNRYYQQGEYEKALEAYNRYMAVASATGLTFLSRANVLAATGRHDEAIADYNRADGDAVILQQGNQDIVLYNRGNSKAEIGDLQGAIRDYTEAIRGDASNPQFFYNRGNAYFDLHLFREAFDDYGVASHFDGPPGPREINSLCNEGLALLAMGRLPEALDTYRRASIIEHGHEVARQNLWTLTRITVLLQGLEYALRVEPDGDTDRIALRFSLPEGYEPVGRELQRLIVFGRVGNTGNTGAPGLVGGEGFDGKPPIFIHYDVEYQ